MTERPILFSAPMVRAILAGTKTQTRRALRIQPPEDCGELRVGPYHPTVIDRHGNEQPGAETFGVFSACGDFALRSPYGQPGDRLWGRENGWERPHRTARDMREGADTWPRYEYDAQPVCCWEDGELKRLGWKRRPSIHMPRWASRILLEVTSMRVEPLQHIGLADSRAEGITFKSQGWHVEDGRHFHCTDPRQSYWSLWESINGPGSVEANPWVWVVEFRRTDGNGVETPVKGRTE